MKNKLLLFILFTFCCTSFGLSQNVLAKEPVNLFFYKQKLIRYYDSGNYARDINKEVYKAIRYLQLRLENPSNKKLAIVLDIDETALSNFPDMVEMKFGGSLKQIKEAEMQGHDPVILPTLRLYKFAKAHHVAVFFVSGRDESERYATIYNLQKAGYKQWNGLILKSDKHLSTIAYKTTARKSLEKEGYDIVVNMGDQQSDLAGGYADKTFKLANPFYFIP